MGEFAYNGAGCTAPPAGGSAKPGPFPGVNPYLEAQGYWPDFHLKFLNYLQEALADGLPDDYEARLDERVNLLDVEAGEARQIKPDVALLQRPKRAGDAHPAGTLLLVPETIPTLILDQDRETYLKVLHRPDRKLVTVLELLSPSNKAEPSRRDYLTRRNAILLQDVHLVELDLLVTGHRLPMKRPLPRADYHAVVSRWERRPDCEVYSWSVRQALPLLPIPLRDPDPDVMIDLASVYQTAFARGKYARSLDENASLNLPFMGDL
jgi:Protein of unknown function (DUF4058)